MVFVCDHSVTTLFPKEGDTLKRMGVLWRSGGLSPWILVVVVCDHSVTTLFSKGGYTLKRMGVLWRSGGLSPWILVVDVCDHFVTTLFPKKGIRSKEWVCCGEVGDCRPFKDYFLFSRV